MHNLVHVFNQSGLDKNLPKYETEFLKMFDATVTEMWSRSLKAIYIYLSTSTTTIQSLKLRLQSQRRLKFKVSPTPGTRQPKADYKLMLSHLKQCGREEREKRGGGGGNPRHTKFVLIFYYNFNHSIILITHALTQTHTHTHRKERGDPKTHKICFNILLY